MRGGISAVRKRGASELIGKFTAFECSYCSVILTEYEDLSLHRKSCPSPSYSMICLTCGEKFPSKPEIRQHLKHVHSHKTFGCKFCDMMFLSSSGLLSHTKAKHKPDPKTLCQICGQAFHNKANLEGHMNMHLGLRPFRCKKCGKCYGHSKSLMTHEKTCIKSVALRGTKSVATPKHPTKTDPEMLSTQNVTGCSDLNLTHHPVRKSRASGRERNTEAVHSNQYLLNDTCQLSSSKRISIERPSLQTVQNNEQPYSFSDSYQSLQTMDLVGITNTANVDEELGDIVFTQPSSDFIVPHMNYGMFPSRILPDNS